jgi:transposase InsO family protein
LLDQSLPAQPDQVWAGDITFIPISAGWLYLAAIIDLHSRGIIGRALADNLRSQLVIDALQQA